LQTPRHNSHKFYTGTVVYADDCAIIISCNDESELILKIDQLTKVYREIANYIGADLEPSKTEVLMHKSLSAKHTQLNILGSDIQVMNEIKWLGYNITLINTPSKNNIHIKLVIPHKKIRAIDNTIKMFKLYNGSPKQNLIFYRIYIRPLVDSWLIDISNLEQITRIEANFLKTALNLKSTTKHSDIYKHINITI